MKIDRLYVIGLLLIVFTGVGSFFLYENFLNPTSEKLEPSQIPEFQFNKDLAFSHLKAQVDIGFRYPGTKEINQTRAYIVTTLKSWNWSVVFHNFTLDGYDVSNILAFPQNISMEGNQTVKLFGAHYDTRLRADRDPILNNRKNPVLGANDGASGVSILLEMARIYRNSSSIALLFIDAEDQGGGAISGWDYSEGASEFVENLDRFFPNGKDSIDYFILFDMIGDKILDIYKEKNSDAGLNNEIFSAASKIGFGNSFRPQYKYAIIDDHIPFKNKGIRAVDLIDFDYVDENGFNLHHTINDTLEHVSAESLGVVGKTIEYWLIQQRIWPKITSE